MADIFSATNERRNSVPTATFDWSHAVHTTTDLGRITPVFCELVPAKTSARINAKLGFQFMPMVFPLQSRIRYRLAFFKYPLRALWTDYRDFIGNFRQDLEEPYIDFGTTPPSTGSLWDYLGLPTTLVGEYGSFFDTSALVQSSYIPLSESYMHSAYNDLESFFAVGRRTNSYIRGAGSDGIPCAWSLNNGGVFLFEYDIPDDADLSKSVIFKPSVSSYLNDTVYTFVDDGETILSGSYLAGANQTFTVLFKNAVGAKRLFIAIRFTTTGTSCPPSISSPYVVELGSSNSYFISTNNLTVTVTFPLSSSSGSVLGLSAQSNPYYSSNNPLKEKQVKISAYAARAYEGIYNSWFRDNRNNPYYLNGQVEYNRWIPNYEGGADPASNYQLRYANWERDFLSTAVQTPQQGIAPLVGITTYEDTVTLEDGTVRTVNKLAITDEDGKSYKIGFDSDDDGLKAVEYQPLNNAQTVKPTSLIQLAQSGISISDLRNVNAYQRYLEMNIRAGYSYKDIIEHRFDVNIGYNELLMPEFIGGTSDWVEMHSVTQTVMKEDNGTYADALGSQAGIAGARKGTETINVFCDEESIILGVLVFTPVPIYTQLLPKHFLYRGLLDHFAPEFANIGFQPILMREVAPVQQWSADKDKMLDTFGYNRPWYEYCQKQDTAHGLYRTQLRNFIMNRVFNEAPSLNQSFLLVDPSQVNDVFAVTETTDKIYGQIYFDAKFKLPIPRVAIPRLE